MLRLKKKAEESKAAEAEAAAGAEAAAAAGGGAGGAGAGAAGVPPGAGDGKVSLLGIGGASAGAKTGAGRKRSAGEIRIQKDITELDTGKAAEAVFPNPNDLTNFNVIVAPDTGCWAGAKYTFNFTIGPNYPHEPPKVVCKTKIFHPNINLEGAVCLNILRADWKPVLDINAVIYGLLYIFYEPEPTDPLNHDAAELYRNNKSQFEAVVRRTLQGYSHSGESFPKLI